MPLFCNNVLEAVEATILELHDVGCIKFGNFVMKSGVETPIYVDLRRVISKPALMVRMCDLLYDLRNQSIAADVICGVPYTALPFATLISVKHGIPMVMRRKEAKAYGTKQKIEGICEAKQRCLIIEDVISSGSSILETVQDIKQHGLEVAETLVFLDRQHGGIANLNDQGLAVTAVCTLQQVIDVLAKSGRITEEMAEKCRAFLHQMQHIEPTVTLMEDPNDYTYGYRAEKTTNPVSQRLLGLMERKKTNLCVALDVSSIDRLLELAALFGPHVVAVKTHVDILPDFTLEKIMKLRSIAQQQDFLIFEDRKFGDIGAVSRKQFVGGVHQASEWADLVTVHGVAGEGTVQGIAGNGFNGALLLAQMSSSGNLITEQYTTSVVKMAEKHDSVAGLISQSRLSPSMGLVHFTPGVRVGVEGDNLGQQYVTPEDAVLKRGADVIIVGRGVTEAAEPLQSLLQYKHLGFQAYQQRVTKQ